MASDREYQVHLEEAHGLVDDPGTSSGVSEPEPHLDPSPEPAVASPPERPESDTSVVTPWGATAATAARVAEEERAEASRAGTRRRVWLGAAAFVLLAALGAALLLTTRDDGSSEQESSRTPATVTGRSTDDEVHGWIATQAPQIMEAIDLALQAADHHLNFASYSESEQIADCLAAAQSGADLAYLPRSGRPEVKRTVDRLANAIERYGQACAENISGSVSVADMGASFEDLGSAMQDFSALVERFG
jgi:hypothetical protein